MPSDLGQAPAEHPEVRKKRVLTKGRMDGWAQFDFFFFLFSSVTRCDVTAEGIFFLISALNNRSLFTVSVIIS